MPTTLCRIALLGAAVGLTAAATAQPDDDLKFSIHGRQRTRYETLDHQFRADLGDGDRALALQTSVYFDWKLDKLAVLAEVMDSRVALNDGQSYLSTSSINTLEPIQAYVSWQHASDVHPGNRSVLRAGRMTLDIGKRRLVARSRFRNTVASFAGLDWERHGLGGQTLRAFYFRPVSALPADDSALLHNAFKLDRVMRRNELFGLYFQPAPASDERTLEVYAFDRVLKPSADSHLTADMAVDHVTVGARLYRPTEPGRMNYELEGAMQRGESGSEVNGSARTGLEHRAYFLHVEVGYELDRPWSPNFAFQYDVASGDSDPTDGRNERFDTLVGARSFDFAPTGIYGPIARANLRSSGVRLALQPQSRWRCGVAYRRVWLDEARDEWVGSGYSDPTGASGRSIGHHLEGSVAWTAITDRLSVDAGVARLSAERFPARVAGSAWHGDPRYFYLSATTTF